MKRKLISLLLLASLLLTLLPLAAFAEEPAAEETENIWGIAADDVIWFGVYEDEPVPWLVLDAGQTNMGTEGLFLLSRDLIDKKTVVYDERSTLWEGSLAQEWCTNFADAAFSPAESALVPYTDKHEDQVYLYALAWRAVDLKQEQVFFLSVMELEQYFGSYSPNIKTTVKRCSMDDYYWLRSPIVYHDDYHGMVMQNNTVHDYLPNHRWSARPCINLSLEDTLWVLPADDAGTPGPAERPAGEEAREWKLLAPLAEHSFRAETADVQGDRLTVRYSGADVGEGAMLSLLIRDEEGKPLSLRRLEQPAAPEGELILDREELALPEGASLFLFCEQLGGENRTNFASPLQKLETEPPAPETPAPEEPAEQADPSQTDILSGEEGDETPRAARMQELLRMLLPAAALAFLVVLAVASIAAAFRRRSFVPLVLMLLFLLLAVLLAYHLRLLPLA